MFNLYFMYFDRVPDEAFDPTPWLIEGPILRTELLSSFAGITFEGAQLFRSPNDPAELLFIQAVVSPGSGPLGYSRQYQAADGQEAALKPLAPSRTEMWCLTAFRCSPGRLLWSPQFGLQTTSPPLSTDLHRCAHLDRAILLVSAASRV